VPDLQPRVTLTESTLRKLENNPNVVPPEVKDEIASLADRYQFFHWHLGFPNVFQHTKSSEIGEDEPLEWRGGFDVVIGNPPWDQLQLDPQEFFALSRPDIAGAANMAARERAIGRLAESDPHLLQVYLEEKRRNEAVQHFIHQSGRFPLTSYGRLNTAPLFSELSRSLIAPTGRIGMIVPTGIATDSFNQHYFRDLIEGRSLASLLSFENEEFLFPAVHHFTKFCLLTIVGSDRPQDQVDLVFFARKAEHLTEQHRRFTLSSSDMRLMNPNTITCPIFRSKRDAEINKVIYRRVPVLIHEGDPEGNPWKASSLLMFMMNTSSYLFRTRDQLEAEGWTLDGNIFRRGDQTYLPLYEAKMVHHFDNRFGTYEGQTDSQANQNKLPELNENDHADPHRVSLPWYWVPEDEVARRLRDRWNQSWLIGWRDITNNTNARTVIASIVPKAGFGDTFLLLFPTMVGDYSPVACLLANLCSFILDYAARQKVGGTHLKYHVFKQLPVLRPASYSTSLPWSADSSWLSWLASRSLELVYTSWELGHFARDCGYHGPPFRWNAARRFLLRCELDAAFFHLYGVNRDDTDYIMETFPVVKKKDIQQHGNYRTKHPILEIYDAMQRAIETGEPYQTLLDPPPADPRVAHPPREGDQ